MAPADLSVLPPKPLPAAAGPVLPGPSAVRNDAALTKAAQEFEGMFFGQMFEQMWSTVDVDPVFGGGSGEEMFRSLMVQEFGKMAAARGGLGLAAPVRAALLQAQEAAR